MCVSDNVWTIASVKRLTVHPLFDMLMCGFMWVPRVFIYIPVLSYNKVYVY